MRTRMPFLLWFAFAFVVQQCSLTGAFHPAESGCGTAAGPIWKKNHGSDRRGKYDDNATCLFASPPTVQNEPDTTTTTTTTSSCRQFFMAFNEHINQRVCQADQATGDVSTAIRHAPITTVQLAEDEVFIIMDNSDASKTMAGQVRDFVEMLIQNGGFALVKLPTESDSKVISNLWKLTKRGFEQVKSRARDDDDKKDQIRHQTLVRQDSPTKTDNVGYAYVEINHGEKSLATLRDFAGEEQGATAMALESLQLLSGTGVNFAGMVLADILSLPFAKARTLVDQLVGASETAKSSSFQRLARYSEASAAHNETENLCSHCDWSIFTIVPVSDVPGLQVFNTNAQTWVSPVEIAKNHAGQNTALTEAWNGAYLVLMAGKWLELLTNAKVKSTVHRVVSPRGTPQRYSMPFFLRLKLDVLEAVECVELESPCDIEASSVALSKFLQQYQHPNSVKTTRV